MRQLLIQVFSWDFNVQLTMKLEGGVHIQEAALKLTVEHSVTNARGLNESIDFPTCV